MFIIYVTFAAQKQQCVPKFFFCRIAIDLGSNAECSWPDLLQQIVLSQEGVPPLFKRVICTSQNTASGLKEVSRPCLQWFSILAFVRHAAPSSLSSPPIIWLRIHTQVEGHTLATLYVCVNLSAVEEEGVFPLPYWFLHHCDGLYRLVCGNSVKTLPTKCWLHLSGCYTRDLLVKSVLLAAIGVVHLWMTREKRKKRREQCAFLISDKVFLNKAIGSFLLRGGIYIIQLP